MRTQAYFENIQQQIIQQVQGAQHSVLVAVAWLTDSAIFNELCNCAKKGTHVELLLVDDNINNDMAPFDHKRLEACGGKVYFIPSQTDGAIMHHKFCVIDDCTVITGSYNWSRKAQLNDENIVITEDACELGEQFKKEFEAIRSRIAGRSTETAAIDYARIIKRLEVIKNFAALEEQDEIQGQVRKLKEQALPHEVNTIIQKLEAQHYTEALMLTEEFIKTKNRIAVYDDAEVFGLQLEIRSLEIQLNALQNELVEAEKLVREFLVRHTKELGTLLIKLLELKKQTASTTEEKAEAEQDEKTYREGYEINKDTVIPELSGEDKKNLVKMYREASMLCHPDRFANEPVEKQKQAEELFKDLAEAYSNNDTVKVNSILQNLKNGILTTDPANTLNKKGLLKVRLETLKNKAAAIGQKIKEVKQTETYSTATDSRDWDTYFYDARRNLELQIENLKKQLVYE